MIALPCRTSTQLQREGRAPIPLRRPAFLPREHIRLAVHTNLSVRDRIAIASQSWGPELSDRAEPSRYSYMIMFLLFLIERVPFVIKTS